MRRHERKKEVDSPMHPNLAGALLPYIWSILDSSYKIHFLMSVVNPRIFHRFEPTGLQE